MSNSVSRNAPRILTKRHIGWGVFMLALIGGIAFMVNGPFSGFLASSTSAVEETNVVKPLAVNIAEIEFVESIEQSRSYTGTVRARQRSDLGFELSGKIKSISVDEGDAVEKGQVLAQLDSKTLIAQQNAILAQLAQSKSKMDELNAGARPETIKAAEAAVDAADAQHRNAESNSNRRKRLYEREQPAISKEEYFQAKYAEEAALAQLNSAQEQLAELNAGTRKEQIAGQESAVKQLDAAAKEIEVAIEKSNLIAPFSGTVTRRYLDPGSIAQSSDPVIKLVEQQHLEAWIGLPVKLVADLELESEHEIRIDGQTFKGTATAKIQELDPATRTQTVLFRLEPKASDQVVSGQLCEIRISSFVESSGCWIPTSALSKGIRGLWSVLVVVPDEMGTNFRVEKRDIDIIKTDSSRVLAKGTIQAGDRIIVNGVHRVSEGQLVTPSDE